MNTYTLRDESTLLIRNAVLGDAADLIDYLRTVGGETSFLTFSADDFSITVEQEEAFIQDALNTPNKLMLVGLVGDTIVSALSFSGGPRPRIAHVGEFGISVLKQYWGKGIASKMIKELIDWAKQSGVVKKINLKVNVQNENAAKLYKKLGFVEEGIVTRDIFVEGQFRDSYLMGLQID